MEEIRYAAFAHGGVALLINTLTDNRNRTASQLRFTLAEYGGSFSQPSSLDRFFRHEGVVRIRLNTVSEEESGCLADKDAESILDKVLNIQQVENFTLGENDADDEAELTCQPQYLRIFRNKLISIGCEVTSFELRWVPIELVELDEDQIEPFANLVEKLEELDDVQNVVHSADMNDPNDDDDDDDDDEHENTTTDK